MTLIRGQYYYMAYDALSHFRDKRGKPIIYARAGEKVMLVSDLNNVVLLENKDNKRFPVETKQILEAETSKK